MSDCKHYDREEIDLYLLLTRENIKLTQCKDCKAWLERILPSNPLKVNEKLKIGIQYP